MAVSTMARTADIRRASRLPLLLAAAVIALQIAYPLTAPGAARDRLTVATVVVFFLASVISAAVSRGARAAAIIVAVTAGGGLLVEGVGVATGIPFGAYAYNGTLGPAVLGVPVVIPLAWTMMGYPALIVGRRITRSRLGAPLAAGAALASWDLFLDPQMVDAGHWTWRGGSGPELLGIPAVNFVGWLVVAVLMMAVLHRAVPVESRTDDTAPVVLYLWTYASSVLAHAAFFGLPGSALLGGVGMGAVVALFLRAERRRR